MLTDGIQKKMDTIQIDINLLIHLCLLRVLFLNPVENNDSYVNMFSLLCGLFSRFVGVEA